MEKSRKIETLSSIVICEGPIDDPATHIYIQPSDADSMKRIAELHGSKINKSVIDGIPYKVEQLKDKYLKMTRELGFEYLSNSEINGIYHFTYDESLRIELRAHIGSFCRHIS